MNGISTGRPPNPVAGRGWWRELWLYFVLFAIPLVGYIHRLVINILIDPISLEFGLTDTQASLLQGPPFALVYGLMVIPMGLLADRGSRVLLLGTGAVLWSMGTLMCGFSPTFAWLFAARMLVGLGEAALMPAAVSLIGDSFPENRRGLAMGIFFMGVNAGFSSAYAVGGIALDLAQAGALPVTPFLAEMSPWRQVFFVLALPGFILPLLLISIGEPERRTAIRHYPVGRSIRRLFSAQPLATILVLLILQATAIAVADNGIYAWLPRLLSRLYELGSTEIGLTLGAVVAIAGALGGPLAGRLTDHWVQRKGPAGPLLVIAVAIGAATIAAPMYALGSIWLVYAATAIWVTAVVAASATTFAFVSIAVPDRLRGISSSLITSVMALVGLGAGPTTIAAALEGFAFAQDRVDAAMVVSALPLCCIALVVVAVILRKVRHLPAPADA